MHLCACVCVCVCVCVVDVRVRAAACVRRVQPPLAAAQVKFVPFNPVDKRTEAIVRDPQGRTFRVTKGAPHVILRMSANQDVLRARVEGAVQELADRGFRSLGIAMAAMTEGDAPPAWDFQGLLSLFDPPRSDTKQTIETALVMGVEVKMITGDHTAIAKETARELGLGTNILNTEILNDASMPSAAKDDIILKAHGFAEVYPEHKFQIVDTIRRLGYVTGMTGDGVNDAPALKRADIGIAVDGATDAAKVCVCVCVCVCVWGGGAHASRVRRRQRTLC